MPPDEFIPLAELTSDIIEIGELMIARAAAFAAELRERVGEEVRVTLNASPVQLDRPGFAGTVRAAFEAHGLTGRSAGIEITEGTLLESGAMERSNLNLLREFGARVLLDCSTTSAPATRPSATCANSRSTRSRSTVPSPTGWSTTATRRR